MTASFILRAPRPSDAEALALLHVKTWRQTYAHLLPEAAFGPESLDARRRMWTVLTAAPDEGRTVRVAESEGELIGFAGSGQIPGGDPARTALELFFIYVDARHHGNGAGQALLDAVLGGQAASLWVARDNPRAQAFYARNGFRPTGEEQADSDYPTLVEVRLSRPARLN